MRFASCGSSPSPSHWRVWLAAGTETAASREASVPAHGHGWPAPGRQPQPPTAPALPACACRSRPARGRFRAMHYLLTLLAVLGFAAVLLRLGRSLVRALGRSAE